MRQSNGRYSQKIVPPAVAASIGPRSRPPGTSNVVQVEQTDRSSGPGVYARQASPPQAGYRVVK